jgi:putative flippase GtrA
VLFHVSISLMAAVNMVTFLVPRGLMAAPLASLAGIAAGATGNYLLGDRVVFTSEPTRLNPE